MISEMNRTELTTKMIVKWKLILTFGMLYYKAMASIIKT